MTKPEDGQKSPQPIEKDIGFFSLSAGIQRVWPLLVALFLALGFLLNAEMTRLNLVQDQAIEKKFVTRIEFDERSKQIVSALEGINKEQEHQRQLLEDALGIGPKGRRDR